jgi:YVTN family beta-propeller protein
VVDTETLKVTATIPVGKSPWGVSIGPSPGAPTT